MVSSLQRDLERELEFLGFNPSPKSDTSNSVCRGAFNDLDSIPGPVSNLDMLLAIRRSLKTVILDWQINRGELPYNLELADRKLTAILNTQGYEVQCIANHSRTSYGASIEYRRPTNILATSPHPVYHSNYAGRSESPSAPAAHYSYKPPSSPTGRRPPACPSPPFAPPTPLYTTSPTSNSYGGKTPYLRPHVEIPTAYPGRPQSTYDRSPPASRSRSPSEPYSSSARPELHKEQMRSPDDSAFTSVAVLLGLSADRLHQVLGFRELRFRSSENRYPFDATPVRTDCLNLLEKVSSISTLKFQGVEVDSLEEMESYIGEQIRDQRFLSSKVMVSFPYEFNSRGSEKARHVCILEYLQQAWRYQDYQGSGKSNPEDLSRMVAAAKAALNARPKVSRAKGRNPVNKPVSFWYINKHCDDIEVAVRSMR